MLPTLADVRYAFRYWARRPLLALTAAGTLALGIAATTSIFSVIDGVLLRPLPWRDPDRLVTIYVVRPHWRTDAALMNAWDRGHVSWPIFHDLQTKSRAFSDVGAWITRRPTLNGDSNEPVYGMQVSASFLPMLGVAPHLGRFFTAAEDASPTDAAIVSYESWQRRFGGAPDILGRRVSLDETSWTIVGVLPPGFNFTHLDPPEFILPWGNVPVAGRHPGNHFMYALGRLTPGVTLQAARDDADPLVRGAETSDRKQARLVSLTDDQLGRTARPLWLLLGASALLLLIACSNVAGLFLGDAQARRHEISVRAALGGGRRRLVRQLFAESLLVAIAASAVGLILALWLVPALVALAPDQLPRLAGVGIDRRVLVFSMACGVLTSVVFGVGPALALARTDPAQALREGGRGSVGRTRAHGLVVAAEIALAVVLVSGAALLGETLVRMTSEPLGFDPARLIVASVRLPPDAGAPPERRVARIDRLVDTLAALPGAVGAAATSTAPFSGSYGSNSIQIDGKPPTNDIVSNRHIVTERYFQTLGIPVLKGRGFDGSDRPGSHVAVVTEEFERRLMDGNAIGRRFTLNGDPHVIIGVVGPTKHRSFTDAAAPAFYALNRQLPTWQTPTLILRSAIDAETMMGTVRRTIETTDAPASIVLLQTMDRMIQRSVAEEAYRAWLSIAFGAMALILSAVGLYGLLARAVAVRRRELGVRMALGAGPGRVMGLVAGDGLRLVAAGVGIGIPVAAALAHLAAAFLYGVTPTSPRVFVLVVLVILGTALLAVALPARRASRLNPVTALRE